MRGLPLAPYGFERPHRPSRTREESAMNTRTAAEDIAAVVAGFQAIGQGDLAGFAALFLPDATWNHRNDDRFAGIQAGRDGIMAFIGESFELSAGTLNPVATALMADGTGGVTAVMHLTASRPDGRTLEDQQILLFALDGDQVRTVDQFVGDPAAVRAFWA
jgi:ketosteroid isomerase-like protein